MTPAGWEAVIGLEVHCELRTRTKLFCGCRNEFGATPNTHVCPVCLGLPGSLPVLNRQAVELAMRIGLALGCRVEPSVFHRKNYFYPDMPKDYQISQYDEPICVEGALTLPDGSQVRIVRAHLEEDTGKTSHIGESGRIHGAGYALVDYNRAGVPLVEIVSAPDIRSAQQARAYVAELRGVLVATGASDGRMEEGSLRVDANVSVRRAGSDVLGTRCEVKNLNSLRSLVRALEHEVARQVGLLEAGQPVVQETRHFDEDRGVTVALRSKEEAFDYRYFPEPDLVALAPEPAWREAVAASQPPLPAARRQALAELFGVARLEGSRAEQAETVLEHGLDALVRAAAEAGVEPSLALARTANEAAAQAEAARQVDPGAYVALLRMEQEGRLSATQAKTVLSELLQHGGDPAGIAERLGLVGLDRGALASVVAEVVAAHPEEWSRFCAGEEKLAGFFTGQVMRRTKGQADGKLVAAELAARRADGAGAP